MADQKMEQIKMGKTLILVNEKKYFFSLVTVNDSFDVEVIYKKYLTFPLWLRRKKCGLSYYKIGKLGNWKKHLSEYDRIILFDSSYSKQIDYLVRKNCFINGCYVYFWNKMHENPLFAKKQLESIDAKFKKYSYNKTDCQKYDIFYNSSFYYPPKLENPKTLTEDVVFCGAVKRMSRLKELDAICAVFNAMKINTWIHVYGESEYQPKNFTLTKELIDYTSYLQMVLISRAILDIDVWKEKACSLRAMEALFFDKKYITNNVHIQEEGFYSPDNIFIIGKDNLNQLNDFIFSEVIPVDDAIKKYYHMDSWIRRFN